MTEFNLAASFVASRLQEAKEVLAFSQQAAVLAQQHAAALQSLVDAHRQKASIPAETPCSLEGEPMSLAVLYRRMLHAAEQNSQLSVAYARELKEQVALQHQPAALCAPRFTLAHLLHRLPSQRMS